MNPSAVKSSKKASSDDSKRKKSHSLNPDSQVNLPGNPTQVAMHYTTTQQAAGIQDGTAVVQNNPVSRSQLQIHSLQSPVHPPTDEVQGILYNIMQQQANITAQLVHRGGCSFITSSSNSNLKVQGSRFKVLYYLSHT